jgi:hypothetical protein
MNDKDNMQKDMGQTKNRGNVILEMFAAAKNQRQRMDAIWKELDAFDRNQQWELSSAPPWLPKPVTNFVHLVKYTKRASFAVENPVAKLRPVSPNGVPLVEKLNKAYEDTFDRIKMRKLIRDNIETAKLLGTGVAFMYWNEEKEGRMGTTIQGDEGFQYQGEIEVRQIEPSSFYPDPNAFTLEDCEYIIVRERRPLSWIKKHPKFKEKYAKIEQAAPSSIDAADRGEIYQRDYGTMNNDRICDFLRCYTKTMNDEGGFDYKVEYMANGKYLMEEPCRPNRYPFEILYDFPQRQDFWGMSTCQFILDNQKIINKVESIIAMIGTLLQNPQKIVDKDSGIDPKHLAKYGNAPNMVYTSNVRPSEAVHIVQPQTIPNQLFNLLEAAKQNIREITGLTESYMGQNVGSLQTSSGVQALIDRATMRDRDQMYDIELYVEGMTKLLIDFMTEFYEEERLVRIFDDKGDVVQWLSYKGNDFADLAYDVVVDVSSKAPITRMREAQEAKELINLQGQFGQQYPTQLLTPQELIKSLNLSKGEEIIARMNMEEMNNQTAEAMEVATMMYEALSNGIPEDQVLQMGQQMFDQKGEGPKQGGSPKQGTGNPQNIPQMA